MKAGFDPGRSQALMGTAKRIVLKIGSALLVDGKNGQIRRDWLRALGDDIAAARERGQEVLVVSSGAIATGRLHLGLSLSSRSLRLEESQAAAATGQIKLAHAYEESLDRHGITVGLVLLTLEDTEDRRRHLNARATLAQLLKLGAVPVINENDTVTTTEIRFGDNDRLAARVAQMISADTLVLLSDIDGLYTADPHRDPEARHLAEVTDIGKEVLAMAGEAPPGYSSGGMVTKLAAARIALAGGCRMVIAHGAAPKPLSRLVEGERCTWFLPSAEPLTARKRWIAGHVNSAGTLTLDDGAIRALQAGKSLLPAGVVAVDGSFERGDAVLLADSQGRVIGRGLTAYDAEDARQIKGRHSREIAAILGYAEREVLIHRDDMVLDRGGHDISSTNMS